MCDDHLAVPRISRREVVGGALAVGAAAVLGVGRGLPAGAATPLPWSAVRPRSAWADAPPTGPLAAEPDVRFLLVHHSASGNAYTAAAVPGILRAFYDLHTGPDRGWRDIAYNFLVDRHGGVWEGRAGSLAGPVRADASGGSQGFAQLVCFIGDASSSPPTAAATTAARRLLAALADRYGISTAPGARTSFTSRGSSRWPAGATVTARTISGHRDMSLTSCPGDTVHRTITDGSLAAAVEALRRTPRGRPAVRRGAQWHLRSSTTSGPATRSLAYGAASDIPVFGDWTGRGTKTPGIVRGSTWHLRFSNTSGLPDLSFSFGRPGDVPVVGDWTGGGRDLPGVVRGGRTWMLRHRLASGVADAVFAFGRPGDVPVVGDWNGDGRDTVGVVRDGRTWLLRNANSGGAASVSLAFGQPGDVPVVGDWNGDGRDSIGVVRGNAWHLRDPLSSGPATQSFSYGAVGDTPLVWRS